MITRFAPSPTGRLHLGHAFSAVLGHARARARTGGKFLLRIEDLDQTRCRPEFVEAFERLANLATAAAVEGRVRIRIRTPLLRLTKREIIALGTRLGVDYGMTTSCYDPLPDGSACGHCDACQLRLRGFAEGGMAAYGRKPHIEGDKLVWNDLPAKSDDETIVRTIDAPFSPEGGFRILKGNLGRACIKVSAVERDRWTIEAPARVFADQSDVQAAFKAGELNGDMIAVVRFSGPKALGMPELHNLTPPLTVLQGRGFKVAPDRHGPEFDPDTGARVITPETPLDGRLVLHGHISESGAAIGRTLMVGDASQDVETARRAGSRVCVARYGFGFTTAEPLLDGTERLGALASNELRGWTGAGQRIRAVRHELENPLAVVTGETQGLRREWIVQAEPALERPVDAIHDAAQRLADLAARLAAIERDPDALVSTGEGGVALRPAEPEGGDEAEPAAQAAAAA